MDVKINAKILKSMKQSSIFLANPTPQHPPPPPPPPPQSDCIEAKLDVIMNRMNNQERRGHSCNEVGIVEVVEQKIINDQELTHEGSYQVEEAQYINGNISYNFKPNNNLLTHYTPALRK